MPSSIDLIRSAELIVRQLLAVKPGERVSIVCDPHSEMEMAHALAGLAQSAGAEYTILMMPTRTPDRSNELTPMIEQALEASDCLIGLTGACGAPTYAASVKQLYDQKRLRGISMVFRNRRHFTEGGALADYPILLREGRTLKALWEAGRVMRITTPAGTDIQAPIAHDHVIVECGFATEPGQEAAFSDGEVSCRPLEGEAEGVIVVDGPICHVGVPDSPIRLTVQTGRVTCCQGESPQARQLRAILNSIENADNIAEFGIGLNPASLRNGDFEEEKKARGLVHIALGDNVFYGGTVHCGVHMDMVLYQPTVDLDGRLLVQQGEVRLEPVERPEA